MVKSTRLPFNQTTRSVLACFVSFVVGYLTGVQLAISAVASAYGYSSKGVREQIRWYNNR